MNDHVLFRRLVIAVLGAALVSPQATAQDAGSPLSLQDCVRMALHVPSPVSLAKRDRDIADKGIVIARAGFLPGSALSSGYTYNSPNRFQRDSMSYVSFNGIREFVGLATIFQEIDVSGRLRAEYALARAQQSAAGVNMMIAERDLKRAVGAAYYRLLLARHLVDVVRDALAESDAFERRVQLLFGGGEAARADVVKASSQTAFLRQALLSAELASSMANQDLAAYWTTDVDAPLSLVDSFSQPEMEPEFAAPGVESTQTGLAPYLRRPEFRLFDAQSQGFAAQARAARAALLPQLRWNFQYGLDVNQLAWNNRGYAAFATLDIPIFDWCRARSGARQFRLQAEQVTETRAISERRFSQEYRSALARVKQFRAQITLCREQVDLAGEDLKLSRIRYEGGEGAAVEVVVAQNQVAQARSNYYSSIANYRTAQLDLEVAAGQ